MRKNTSLFLHDLAPFLLENEGHSPKIGSTQAPLLLYADDAVLVSHTKLSLKHLMYKCLEFLANNNLQLNYYKSKIMVFTKPWKLHKWIFKGRKIEQVKHLRYLGIMFHFKYSWVLHRKAALQQTKGTIQSVHRMGSFPRANSIYVHVENPGSTNLCAMRGPLFRDEPK